MTKRLEAILSSLRLRARAALVSRRAARWKRRAVQVRELFGERRAPFELVKEALGVVDWEGTCPHCGEEHPDGQGFTIASHFAPYASDPGGAGFRIFLCNGCGRPLEEDIST